MPRLCGESASFLTGTHIMSFNAWKQLPPWPLHLHCTIPFTIGTCLNDVEKGQHTGPTTYLISQESSELLGREQASLEPQ